MDVATSFGVARLTWRGVSTTSARALLLLGHSAGGGIDAPDLVRVSTIAGTAGYAVGLVEQPYRVAGRRAPVSAAQLDVAFMEVAEAARAQLGQRDEHRFVVGGRSSGARVACRTARTIGANGVLALGFPLQPPRRRTSTTPAREAPSRLPELVNAGVPTLVVQGDRDAFGTANQLSRAVKRAQKSAPMTAQAGVVVSTAIGADHSLRKGIDDAAIADWLARFLP